MSAAPRAGRSRRGRASVAATRSEVRRSESGVRLMESMPCSTRNSAKSGKSLGACPQIPTFCPARLGGVVCARAGLPPRRVALVEERSDQRRIAIDAQDELGEVVRTDGETV